MSVATRNPLRMAGAVVNSGDVNTGELLVSQGGGRKFCLFSGALLLGSGGTPVVAGPYVAGHCVIFSGAGRLHKIIPHQSISGVAAVFYDSSVACLSGVGTFGQSGRPIVGVMPANTWSDMNTLGGPLPLLVEAPFSSGLAVSAPSGCAGFTVTYTPETNQAFG